MSQLRNKHFQTSIKFHNENKTSVFKIRGASQQAKLNPIKGSERVKTEPDLHIKSLYNQ
jgi:hypothetical protein